jgi:hypothetical protein
VDPDIVESFLAPSAIERIAEAYDLLLRKPPPGEAGAVG